MIVECRGQHLELLAERAALWVERRTLLIADPHFGKASVFRANGIPIPGGTTRANLDRIDALLVSTRAERMIFLGDFVHGMIDPRADFVKALQAWRALHSHLEIYLLIGNHDRFCGPLAETLNMRCTSELLEGPFLFRHHPDPDPRGYVIGGHLHPAFELTDRDGARLRLRVFWFQKSVAVLPSFGEFTGSAFIQPAAGDGVYAVGEGGVATLMRYRP
jgi:DNA ligase-associated metallophosphoesterase